MRTFRNTEDEILKYLKTVQFDNCSSIGEKLGIHRVTVWRYMVGLERSGLVKRGIFHNYIVWSRT